MKAHQEFAQTFWYLIKISLTCFVIENSLFLIFVFVLIYQKIQHTNLVFQTV